MFTKFTVAAVVACSAAATEWRGSYGGARSFSSSPYRGGSRYGSISGGRPRSISGSRYRATPSRSYGSSYSRGPSAGAVRSLGAIGGYASRTPTQRIGSLSPSRYSGYRGPSARYQPQKRSYGGLGAYGGLGGLGGYGRIDATPEASRADYTPDRGYNRVRDLDMTRNRADLIQRNRNYAGIDMDRRVDPDMTRNRMDYGGINKDRATDFDRTLDRRGYGGYQAGPTASVARHGGISRGGLSQGAYGRQGYGGYQGYTGGYGGYGGVAGYGGIGGINQNITPMGPSAVPKAPLSLKQGDIEVGPDGGADQVAKVISKPIKEIEQVEVEDDIEDDEIFGADEYEIESRPLNIPEKENEYEVQVEAEAGGEIETKLEKEVDLENEMVGEQEEELEAELNFEVEAKGEVEVAAESEPVGETEAEGELETEEKADDAEAVPDQPQIEMPKPPAGFGGMSLKDQLQAGQFGGKFRPGLGLAGLFQSGAIGGLGAAGSSFGVGGGFSKPTVKSTGQGITSLGSNIMGGGLTGGIGGAGGLGALGQAGIQQIRSQLPKQQQQPVQQVQQVRQVQQVQGYGGYGGYQAPQQQYGGYQQSYGGSYQQGGYGGYQAPQQQAYGGYSAGYGGSYAAPRW